MAKKGALKDLEAKLAERAEVNVQAKIKVFRADIEAALLKLFGQAPSNVRNTNEFGTLYFTEPSRIDEYAFVLAKCKVLELAIQDRDYVQRTGTTTKRPWPQILWDVEINRLRDELLAKMDLMQQLINAPARDTSNDVPHESEA